MLAVALGWALYSCADIEKFRSQGMTDAQMESYAHEQHIPQWVINRAKAKCKAVDKR
jgi:hypothetical protein